jgi:hypothetical protein
MTPTDAVLKHLDLVDKYAHAYAMGGVHAAWPARADVVASAYALVYIGHSPDAEDEPTLRISQAEAAPFFNADGSWNAQPFGSTPEEVKANLARYMATKSPAAPDA